MPEPGNVRILRSAERYRTDRDGIVTRHCFAFGDHYDPDNTGFGDLVAVNDEYVDPGCGYDLHRHRDTEIVTWVLDGVLEHEDTTGRSGSIGVGTVARMSAGTGVQHAERNASGDRPVRFVQMWLRTGAPDAPPSYEQAVVAHLLPGAGFVPVVGDGAVIGIGTPGASLWIARPAAGPPVRLPPAPLRHLQVVRGRVGIGEHGFLEAGDTARITAPDGVAEVAPDEPSELLLWAMHPTS